MYTAFSTDHHLLQIFLFLSTHLKNTFGFLTFLGGIEMEHWAKMGYFVFLSLRIFLTIFTAKKMTF